MVLKFYIEKKILYTIIVNRRRKIMSSKTSTNLNTLSINQIPTRALYRQLKNNNQLNKE